MNNYFKKEVKNAKSSFYRNTVEDLKTKILANGILP